MLRVVPPDASPLNRSSTFTAETRRLLRPFAYVVVLATMLGCMSGVATALLLEQINSALHDSSAIARSTAVGLAALGLLAVGSHALAGIVNSFTGQRVVAALRKDVSLRILHAPVASIEHMKSHRLQAILNEDINTISTFTAEFAGHASAFAVTAGCAIYLLKLSPVLFMLSAVAIGVGIVFTYLAAKIWIRDFNAARVAEDDLQKQYRAVIEGAKELRLNRHRRAHVHGLRLASAADEVARRNARALSLFWAAEGTNSALFFLVVLTILIARPWLALDAEVASGFVIVLLFVKGPIEELASLLPFFSQAQVAFRRIARLSADFSREKEALASDPVRVAALAGYIELCQVYYRFDAPGGGPAPFELGPIDLRIQRGEILFIVGGNGSGKTTLVKLLLGLYRPSQGQVLLDGVAVDDSLREAYRALFSAIFSDYFLFDELVDPSPEQQRTANALLERLKISGKTELAEGAFSTTDLSTGQRKRLALIHAWLEDRPVMLFDEWAADQDPEFRQVFYLELLPELKRLGKTLIVISHDDRYFGVADRVIRLDQGQIADEVSHLGKA